MTDNSAPGVYTQPDGDADDVLGHRFIANDKKAAHDDADDTEGHRLVQSDRVQDRQVADDTDDVQGHVRVRDRIADRVGAHDDDDDDADDVEGHRKA